MSSCRVLVGLAAECAPLSCSVPRRTHGFPGLAGAVRRPRVVTTRSPFIIGRISNARGLPPYLLRPFHTTSPTPERHRTPRTFHLTGPQPPTIHPHSSTTTTTSTDSTPPLPEHFRTVMRLLTHSVVVCTATHPSTTPSEPAIPRAMTMSSFTSLALRPSPVVSFNIAVPSRTFDAVAASRRFNIHVLADDESGARVADWFAGGNTEGREVFERLIEGGGVERVRFMPGSAVEGGVNGGNEEPPVLEGDGVLYVLRCRLLDDEPCRGLVKVRGHYIVLGEVLEIVEGAGAQREVEERFGLLYTDRRYRQLGGCITPGEKELGGP